MRAHRIVTFRSHLAVTLVICGSLLCFPLPALGQFEIPDDPPGGGSPPCEVPGISCPSTPPPFTVTYPPPVVLPPDPPGASSCGSCTVSGNVCLSNADCTGGGTDHCAWPCPPSGPCQIPDPGGDYLDFRCVPALAGEPDDTCRLKRALTSAAGRVLWIAPEVSVGVSSFGNDSCPGLGNGINVPSNTTIAGGGTIRLRTDTPGGRQYELDHGMQMLNVKNVHNVTITGMHLDFNATAMQCPDACVQKDADPPLEWDHYVCEHRHAIYLWESTDVTVTNTWFFNLLGDGVYVNGTQAQPARILIQDNTFYADPNYRNRNGVSVGRGEDIVIDHNYFEGMGRAPMPGAIDLESNCATDITRRVRITDNTIVGYDGCYNNAGIGVSNNVVAAYANILVSGNHVSGCEQAGILVNAAGISTQPVVLLDNTIETKGPHYVNPPNCELADPALDPAQRSHWGILVVGKVFPPKAPGSCAGLTSWTRMGSYVHAADNVIHAALDGPNMTGIYVASSKAVLERNTVEDPDGWGIYLYPPYVCPTPSATVPACPTGWHGYVNPAFTRTLCENDLARCGTAGNPATGGISLQKDGSLLEANEIRFSTSPVGIRVENGANDVFRDNVFEGVSYCASGQPGCIWCPSAGAQYFSANSVVGGGSFTTSCASVCP